jgi:transposase
VASRHRITTHRLHPRACPPQTGHAAVGQVRHRSVRRVFSRFDQDARRYLAFVHFASTVIWLK